MSLQRGTGASVNPLKNWLLNTRLSIEFWQAPHVSLPFIDCSIPPTVEPTSGLRPKSLAAEAPMPHLFTDVRRTARWGFDWSYYRIYRFTSKWPLRQPRSASSHNLDLRKWSGDGLMAYNAAWQEDAVRKKKKRDTGYERHASQLDLRSQSFLLRGLPLRERREKTQLYWPTKWREKKKKQLLELQKRETLKQDSSITCPLFFWCGSGKGWVASLSYSTVTWLISQIGEK